MDGSNPDIIVVGTGSCACTLVHYLLKEHEDLSITMLEAGHDQSGYPTLSIPQLMFKIFGTDAVKPYIGKAKYGRTIPILQGNVLGGSSSVNFMHYSRGGRDDYDAWQSGWQYKDLEPHFKRIEHYYPESGQSLDCHGSNGPVHVTRPAWVESLWEGATQAAQKTDLPSVPDLHDFQTAHGMSRTFLLIDPKTRRRCDAWTSFISPLMQDSLYNKRLTVLTDSQVTEVLFDQNKKATGVTYLYNNVKHTLSANKLVVLSAGTLSTPCILERSGIGNASYLESLGIQSVSDLPGVGAQYYDHPLLQVRYLFRPETPTSHSFFSKLPDALQQLIEDWTLGKSTGDCLSRTASDVLVKLHPNDEEAAEMGSSITNLMKRKTTSLSEIIPIEGLGSTDMTNMPKGTYMSYGTVLFHPTSKGHLHITSSDPSAPVDFDPALLDTDTDLKAMIWTLKKAHQLAINNPYFQEPVLSMNPKSDSFEDWKSWARERIQTTWHPIGTCPMLPKSEGGVIDTNLSVYGVSGLKVVDMSFCTGHISGHTTMTALAIGSRAAEVIGSELRGKSIV